MQSEVVTGVPTCSPDCAMCGRLRASAAAAVLIVDGGPVTMAALAMAAGVSLSETRGHCPEGAQQLVAEAYRRAAGELFDNYAAAFHRGRSWPEKLTVALERLLGRLAAEPALAHLCFVAPSSGHQELQEIREAFRERYVRLLDDEQPWDDEIDAQLPSLQLELMIGAMFRAIADLVRDGRAPELPSHLDEIAGAAQVFEPRVPVTA
jgi:hypothetical protein